MKLSDTYYLVDMSTDGVSDWCSKKSREENGLAEGGMRCFFFLLVGRGFVSMFSAVEDIFIIRMGATFCQLVRKVMTMYPQFERSNSKVHSVQHFGRFCSIFS